MAPAGTHTLHTRTEFCQDTLTGSLETIEVNMWHHVEEKQYDYCDKMTKLIQEQSKSG